MILEKGYVSGEPDSCPGFWLRRVFLTMVQGIDPEQRGSLTGLRRQRFELRAVAVGSFQDRVHEMTKLTGVGVGGTDVCMGFPCE